MTALRTFVRGARRALHRSAPGRWLERRRQLATLRAWSAADAASAAFYATFVRDGDVVFDVGANAGNRTKVFVRLGARVIAVEPQPACASLLAHAFAREPRVTVVPQALGARPGTAEMQLSEASTIASMSKEWIDAVRSSGRFAVYHWNRSVRVPVTTLDALVERYGVPAFIKIDVEGYELPVLEGLSRPVPALSFEFTPECADSGVQCIERLRSLGFQSFRYSSGETMQFEAGGWLDAAVLKARLEALRGDVHTFGDVYARSEAAPAASAG